MTNATLIKFPAESDLFYLDCTNLLADDESITGTPALSFEPAGLTDGDALEFGAPSVNAQAVDFPDGHRGKIGCVIVVRISGGSTLDAATERDYTVVATFNTSAGNTKQARGRLLVLPLAL